MWLTLRFCATIDLTRLDVFNKECEDVRVSDSAKLSVRLFVNVCVINLEYSR